MRQIVHRIEEACGLSSIKEVVEKAERHQDTSTTLIELRKNLQVKVISLMNRRDTLRKQLEGEVTGNADLLEDESTQDKKFDEKEKRMIAT